MALVDTDSPEFKEAVLNILRDPLALNDIHNYSDFLDVPDGLHHTLGPRHDQSSYGDHSHNGKDSNATLMPSGLYVTGSESYLTGYGGNTHRTRVTNDSTRTYFQTDDELQFGPLLTTSNPRFRVKTTDVALIAASPTLGLINNWNGNGAGGNGGWYKISDGIVTGIGWTSTSVAGTYADPPTIILPVNGNTSMPRSGTWTSLTNGTSMAQICGIWNYRAAGTGTTYSGFIVFQDDTSIGGPDNFNMQRADNGALFSIQPGVNDMCTVQYCFAV